MFNIQGYKGRNSNLFEIEINDSDVELEIGSRFTLMWWIVPTLICLFLGISLYEVEFNSSFFNNVVFGRQFNFFFALVGGSFIAAISSVVVFGKTYLTIAPKNTN